MIPPGSHRLTVVLASAVMLLVLSPPAALVEPVTAAFSPDAPSAPPQPHRPLDVQDLVSVAISGDSFVYQPGLHSPNVVSTIGTVTVTVALPNHPTVVNLLGSTDTGWSVVLGDCSLEFMRPGAMDFSIAVYAPSVTQRGVNVTLTVTADAKAFGLPEQQASDDAHIVVAPQYRADLTTPGGSFRCHRGSTVTVHGNITNLGNGEDVFVINVLPPNDGLRTPGPLRIPVPAGGSRDFTLEFGIDSDAPLQILDATIDVRAEGDTGTSMLDTEVVSIDVVARGGAGSYLSIAVIAAAVMASLAVIGYVVRRRRRRALGQ